MQCDPLMGYAMACASSWRSRARLGRVSPYGLGVCVHLDDDAGVSCAPANVLFIGTCEPAPRYYWTGSGCEGLTGCSCEGSDCTDGFASMAGCEEAFASCE